ncbi:hypothetical protein M0802_016989 [Mischocyttarus mexicanus]|nr:hypothetical protein M0802_016989 [Mischocyttarus mexicanus]
MRGEESREEKQKRGGIEGGDGDGGSSGKGSTGEYTGRFYEGFWKVAMEKFSEANELLVSQR